MKILKYILIGDSCVGKSSLMIQLIDKKFFNLHDTTIGVEFGKYTYKIKNDEVRINIWDTAGQETFRSITRSYFRGSHCAILIFDLTSRSSFDNASKWYNDIKENTKDTTKIILVGNKNDLPHRKVTQLEALNFAAEHNMRYIETSAKDGTNVQKLFIDSVNDIYDDIESGIIVLEPSRIFKKNNENNEKNNYKNGFYNLYGYCSII
ncbi:rab domain-containing protein [Bodo saltans virus]|uniref:Rab domain-containing protein n=1 Tax=Bodo saltans virus TaxID=2024608 RepID=A0A2H4UVZ9_9VIRU|nr:rab domain-containing protein [Bodo saltans virus]ATZ81046.1 rab domain-containing protein [Bodo saltans virus]